MKNIFTNKINKNMLMLLTCQFIASGSAFAYLDLDDINPEEYKTAYNRLPSVEDSNSHVKARTPELSYLEINNGDLEKSVVQAWNAKEKPQSVIRTSWSSNNESQLDCLQVSYCVNVELAHVQLFYHKSI